jgi:hypothetical protein
LDLQTNLDYTDAGRIQEHGVWSATAENDRDISDGVVFGSFGNESPVREVRNNDKS